MPPTRKVRFRTPEPKTLEDLTSGAAVKVPQLIRLAENLGTEEVGTNLTPEQASELADQGYISDTMQKDLVKEVKVIKETLMAYGKKHKIKDILGVDGKAVISASTHTVTGSATQLAKLLKKEGKTKLFDTLVGVKLGEAKKYLGEMALKQYKFITSKTESYGKIGFKPKK